MRDAKCVAAVAASSVRGVDARTNYPNTSTVEHSYTCISTQI